MNAVSFPSTWRDRLADTRLGRRLATMVFQPRGAESGEVFLNQRRVFILPTRAGLLLALMLVALLLGSINYSLSLGFGLTFLVVGVAWIGMLATFRNLAHLHLRPLRVEPVFAGDTAEYRLVIRNAATIDRYAIELAVDGLMRGVPCDPPAGQEQDVTIPVTVERRGRQPMPRITLATRFPLGLWRAWSYWTPDLAALVYPRPAEVGTPLPLAQGHGRDHRAERIRGSEDFAGLRAYVAGDPVRHIAWRAMARNPEGRVMTKLFDGGASGEGVAHARGRARAHRALRGRAVADDAVGARRRGRGDALRTRAPRDAYRAEPRPRPSRGLPRSAGAGGRMNTLGVPALRRTPFAALAAAIGQREREVRDTLWLLLTLAWVLSPHALALPLWCTGAVVALHRVARVADVERPSTAASPDPDRADLRRRHRGVARVPHHLRQGCGCRVRDVAARSQAARDARASRHLRRHLPQPLRDADVAVRVAVDGDGRGSAGGLLDAGDRAGVGAVRDLRAALEGQGAHRAAAGGLRAAADGHSVRPLPAHRRSAVGHAERRLRRQVRPERSDGAGQLRAAVRVARDGVPRALRRAHPATVRALLARPGTRCVRRSRVDADRAATQRVAFADDRPHVGDRLQRDARAQQPDPGCSRSTCRRSVLRPRWSRASARTSRSSATTWSASARSTSRGRTRAIAPASTRTASAFRIGSSCRPASTRGRTRSPRRFRPTNSVPIPSPRRRPTRRATAIG